MELLAHIIKCRKESVELVLWSTRIEGHLVAQTLPDSLSPSLVPYPLCVYVPMR